MAKAYRDDSRRKEPRRVTNPDWIEEHRAALQNIGELLQAKRLIAFVGAGVSAASGYPSWSRLLTRLQQNVLDLPTVPESPKYVSQLKRMKDDLWRAEEYRRLLGPAGFNAILWNQFKPRNVPEPDVLTSLVQLPFRHFLTTNYDYTLETALKRISGESKPPVVIEWHETDRLSQFLSCLSSADGDRHLVYIHGRISDPSRIILTESDYVNRYVMNDDADRKLFALLITQPVLFVGFSLNDPELTYIMRNARSDLLASYRREST